MKKHAKLKKVVLTLSALTFFLVLFTALPPRAAAADAFPFDLLNGTANSQETASTVRIILLLTVLSLAPSILIMMTAFTRIIIVLSFVRNAMGTNQMPPNQVLIGLALFLTFFVMSPVATQVYNDAYKPFVEEKIDQQQAYTNAMKPMREFMYKQTGAKDLNMFLELSNTPEPKELTDIPTRVLIPAYITSEIKRGFEIGFFIFIPFIIIDMVVASTLMSMGMMMVPPVMISLPFKILLFILVDGWGLTIGTLIKSFHMG